MRTVRFLPMLLLLQVALVRPAASLPPCDWLVYDAAQGEPQLLFIDFDATPPAAMRANAGFYAAGGTLAQRGGVDFDGDGVTDPFRVHYRQDGVYHWQSLRGTAPALDWADIGAYDDIQNPYRFGDLDGDGRSDVFTTARKPNNTFQWLFSSAGAGDFQSLGFDTLDPFFLRTGRFDADVKTDVFASMETSSGSGEFQYKYSSGGSGPYTNLITGPLDAARLRLADFDRDGTTDLLSIALSGVRFLWQISPGGTSPFAEVGAFVPGPEDVQVGDFDGDGRGEALMTLPLTGGEILWTSMPSFRELNRVDGPVPMLGNFVGDPRTDAVILRCGPQPLLRVRPAVVVPKDTTDPIFRYHAAELNGDGRPDLIRTAHCQGYFVGTTECAEKQNLVGGVLGDGQGGFVAAPITPAPTPDTDVTTEFFADVTGDGLTDVVWVHTDDDASQFIVYVGRAVGDGSFAIGAPQTFDVSSRWNPYLVDLNHDGRADLIWTSVCMVGAGRGFEPYRCRFGGSGDNDIATALAQPNGTFLLDPRVRRFIGDSWDEYVALVGDVNGDGNTDLVFNSICQQNVCQASANHLYTALGDGLGEFELGELQTFGTSGWVDYAHFGTHLADVNGDGRHDLVYFARCPGEAGDSPCAGGGSYLIRVGIADTSGGFAVLAPQDLGFGYWGIFTGVGRGDLNGDGTTDLFLHAVRNPEIDSGLVYELLSKGEGHFTVAPMQVLNGNRWYAVDGPVVEDVTSDGRADLVWTDSASMFTGDRILVAADPSAPNTPGTTTTTTTTIPTNPEVGCASLSGLSAAQCLCSGSLAVAACSSATVPPRVGGGRAKACELIDRATERTGKSYRKLLGKALKQVKKAGKIVGRRKVQKKLGPGCVEALRDKLSLLAVRTREARALTP